MKNLFSHSACVRVCSLAPPPGQKDLCRLKVWVSFPPVKILVPYLMFTLRYDITHGNAKIFFLIVCLRDIIKEKKHYQKTDQNLGYVSDLLSLQKSPLGLIRNMGCKQACAGLRPASCFEWSLKEEAALLMCSLTHQKQWMSFVISWSRTSNFTFLRNLETTMYLSLPPFFKLRWVQGIFQKSQTFLTIAQE